MATAVAAAVGLGGAGAAQAVPATVQPHPAATWQTNGRVNAIVVSKGTVYLGGQFTSLRPPGAAPGVGEVARNHVAAVSLSTGALLPWNPDANGTVRALKVAGGYVYLGGAFSQVGGAAHVRLAKVSAAGAGAVVPTWTASASGEVFSLTYRAGTVFAGGGFGTVDGSARANLAAVSATDGSVLPWNPGTDGQVKAIEFTSGTRLVVGGSFAHLAGAAAGNLGAVDADSGAPLQWQSHVSYPVIGLAGDAAGVYVAGAGGGGNFAAFDPATGRTLWMGGTNGNVQAIGVSAGVVYLGGHFQTYCGPQHGQHTCTTPVARDKLLAVDETNGSLLPWNPSANSVLGVFALRGAGGDMLVGGDFTSTGQRKQQGYAQYTP